MISLIIPTYNKLSRLKLTLESLKNQTLDKSMYELILVDDSSADGTEEYVQLQKSILDINFKYIRHEKNVGRAGSRNTGIMNCTGNYLVFSDDDCIMCPRFLESHYRNMQEGYAVHGAIWNLSYLKFFQDPTKGILYREFHNVNVKTLKKKCISLQDVINHFELIEKSAKKTKFEMQVEKALFYENSMFPWIASTGGNIALFAEDIKKIEMFDENLGKQWGAEDIEMGYRLHKYGIRFKYVNEAAVYHIDHYRRNSTELSELAIGYMQNKHKDLLLKYAFNCFFNGALDYDLWERITKQELYEKEQ